MASKTRWESTGDLMFWTMVTSSSVGTGAEMISWWYHPAHGYSVAAFGVTFVIGTLTSIAYVIHVFQKRFQRSAQ